MLPADRCFNTRPCAIQEGGLNLPYRTASFEDLILSFSIIFRMQIFIPVIIFLQISSSLFAETFGTGEVEDSSASLEKSSTSSQRGRPSLRIRQYRIGRPRRIQRWRTRNIGIAENRGDSSTESSTLSYPSTSGKTSAEGRVRQQRTAQTNRNHRTNTTNEQDGEIDFDRSLHIHRQQRDGQSAGTQSADSQHIRRHHGHQKSRSKKHDRVRPYPTPSCPTCWIREEVKRIRIEQIKKQILTKLGLKAAPNITMKKLPNIPGLLKLVDGFGMQGDGPVFRLNSNNYGGNDDYATTLRVFVLAKPVPTSIKLNYTDSCYFTFTPEVRRSKVISATFQVYLRPTTISQMEATYILIYHINPPDSKHQPSLIRYRKVNSDEIKKGGWWKFDILSTVERWIMKPESNYGLRVQIYDNDGKSLAVTAESEEANATRPFIDLKVEDQGSPRAKRMLGLDCDETSEEERCCRYPLKVDFGNLGWDWIAAPRYYDAWYCSGNCPSYAVKLQKYPHTKFITGMNGENKTHGNKTIGPCCTANKMSSLSLIYMDDSNNFIYGNLPGMVVDRCGCT